MRLRPGQASIYGGDPAMTTATVKVVHGDFTVEPLRVRYGTGHRTGFLVQESDTTVAFVWTTEEVTAILARGGSLRRTHGLEGS